MKIRELKQILKKWPKDWDNMDVLVEDEERYKHIYGFKFTASSIIMLKTNDNLNLSCDIMEK